MSVVLIPGRFVGEMHPQGTLASTMLSVSLASAVEAGRLKRARDYVNGGNVQQLVLDVGTLTGTVMGSRAQPYTVVIRVPLVAVEGATPSALKAHLTRITPSAADLSATCTCADPSPLCKHAAATVLAFAFELRSRPELLIHWRTSTTATSHRTSSIAGRARRTDNGTLEPPSATPSSVPRLPSFTPVQPTPIERPAPVWLSPEFEAFLGTPPPDAHSIVQHIPNEPLMVGRATVGSIDVGAFVAQVLTALREQ